MKLLKMDKRFYYLNYIVSKYKLIIFKFKLKFIKSIIQ